MISVWMMEMVADEIVHMVAVGNPGVPAVGAVDMRVVVAAAAVLRRARVRVGDAHLEHVLVDVIAVGMVEMPVVEVVDVSFVLDSDVAAARPVLVRMALMESMFGRSHGASVRAVPSRFPQLRMRHVHIHGAASKPAQPRLPRAAPLPASVPELSLLRASRCACLSPVIPGCGAAQAWTASLPWSSQWSPCGWCRWSSTR
jgi:hypothetical protein